MRIEILKKKLTATELGISGTNDWYIDIPQKLTFIFQEFNNKDMIDFIDKTSGKVYTLKLFIKNDNSQMWLKLFNQYQKEKGLKCSDEIIIEKVNDNEKVKFYIDIIKYENRYELEYIKKQEKFQTYTHIENKLEELFGDISIINNEGNKVELNIYKDGSYKKRRDSAKENALYKIDGIEEIINNYKGENIILQLKDNKQNIYEVFIPVKYSYQVIKY